MFLAQVHALIFTVNMKCLSYLCSVIVLVNFSQSLAEAPYGKSLRVKASYMISVAEMLHLSFDWFCSNLQKSYYY